MQPKLTIAIPTYNRLNSLKKSLGKAIEYSKGKNIEILVSDNASTDGTKEYIASIRKEYPHLNYYRNEKNLGLDGNFLNCMEKAQGKYLLMLSDDDYLLPGAVEKILEAIELNPIFIHLNNHWVNDESSARFSPKLGNLILNDKNKFLKIINAYITFTSSLVYNMDMVKQIDNKEQYWGEELLLSHVALRSMKRDGTYVVITHSCFSASLSPVSYDFYNTFYPGLAKVFLDTGIKSGFSEEAVNSALYDSWNKVYLHVCLRAQYVGEPVEKWSKSVVMPAVSLYHNLTPLYKLVINTPKTRIFENRYALQRMCMKEMFDFCHKYKNIYLYGIGHNAEIFYQYLIEQNIKITGAIISDGEPKKDFHHLNIYNLSELELNEQDDGIILTPKEMIQTEMIVNLEKKKCINNIYRCETRFLICPYPN